jgi:hypothetical protein
VTQTKSLDLTSESVEAATLSIASAGLRGHLGLSVMTDHAKARVVERSLHDAPPLLRGEVYKVLYVLHLREQSTQGERVVTLKPVAQRRPLARNVDALLSLAVRGVAAAHFLGGTSLRQASSLAF